MAQLPYMLGVQPALLGSILPLLGSVSAAALMRGGN